MKSKAVINSSTFKEESHGGAWPGCPQLIAGQGTGQGWGKLPLGAAAPAAVREGGRPVSRKKWVMGGESNKEVIDVKERDCLLNLSLQRFNF